MKAGIDDVDGPDGLHAQSATTPSDRLPRLEPRVARQQGKLEVSWPARDDAVEGISAEYSAARKIARRQIEGLIGRVAEEIVEEERRAPRSIRRSRRGARLPDDGAGTVKDRLAPLAPRSGVEPRLPSRAPPAPEDQGMGVRDESRLSHGLRRTTRDGEPSGE